MRVLVTGANGFLGRAVVAAFLEKGYGVRALVRPAAKVDGLWDDRVQIVRADLRLPLTPDELFEGTDVVVHLAADIIGGEEEQWASTVVGTERLLAAMNTSEIKRLVLASSFSVYDWSAAGTVLTENTPIARNLVERGGYATAKVWQERLVRRAVDAYSLQLTVLRPGYIWGQAHEYPPGVGQSMGRVHVVMGGLTRLPLTYVENCADCFVAATESQQAIGGTFNVIDDDGVRAWRYMGEYLRRTGTPGMRVVVPYGLSLRLVRLVQKTSKRVFHGKGKLPSVMMPARFEARFKPLRFPNTELREVLGWHPRHNFEDALERTYGGPSSEAESQGYLRALPALDRRRARRSWRVSRSGNDRRMRGM